MFCNAIKLSQSVQHHAYSELHWERHAKWNSCLILSCQKLRPIPIMAKMHYHLLCLQVINLRERDLISHFILYLRLNLQIPTPYEIRYFYSPPGRQKCANARVPVGKVEELIRLIQNSLEPESISTPWKLNQRFAEFQFRSFFWKKKSRILKGPQSFSYLDYLFWNFGSVIHALFDHVVKFILLFISGLRTATK